MWTTRYDVLIVGAGVAGSALAHALSTLPREKPLRIALLERSLAEPDRIVGELLQPGGVAALQELGLESCLENIDAVNVRGYCVVSGDQTVEVPYPGMAEGRSFHHGRFIMNLRAAARRAADVDVIEATVTDMVRCHYARKIIGVHAIRKDGAVSGEDGDKVTMFADLVVVADGCFSNFRTSVMGPTAAKASTRSHFVGVVLEDAPLPLQEHGTVVLVKGSGPVLLYQISKHDTRMLVDVKHPVPSDLKSHILTNIIPQLPLPLRCPAEVALTKDRLRRMPNTFLPAVQQGNAASTAGIILLGDSWNMRHPLTGGGMTVALNDVVILRSLLGALPDFKDADQLSTVFRKWHWRRKPVAATVNILSVALHDLFGGEDEDLEVLRTGCIKYFDRGGACITGPASLLSVVVPSPVLLARHFFAVALYSIWVLFTHTRAVPGLHGKPRYVAPSVNEYPVLFRRSIKILQTASRVFLPLVWSELRWWAPSAPAKTTEPYRLPVTLTISIVWFTVPMLIWTLALFLHII
ncbi:squalene epoxidase-domain-containing protein [Mycena maculata]|uniref:Squalene monooxygenase n=1 Tax=Mycena maculata TaxID=230809 RepID=A0AAD7IGQ5_9AGAR|nr:squalene epoxidase-domain-containing protein [Mycena maculata]